MPEAKRPKREAWFGKKRETKFILRYFFGGI